jgi:peptide/nickel transport system substrate-binding protein
MVEKPQYGGTASCLLTTTTHTTTFDPAIATTAASNAGLVYGRLAIGDWTKGPQGTNEYSFESSWIADPYLTGELAESWERPDLNIIIFHLRKGVYWQSLPPVNGREFTADDVVYSFEYNKKEPRSVWYGTGAKCEKIDKYTIKVSEGEPPVTFRKLHAWTNWLYLLPKEAVDKATADKTTINDWRYTVGIGPFMLKDVVSGSSCTWVRNPTYWRSDPFHPQNKLPYIDKLDGIVMLDESTQLAAMRTGKLERLGVAWDKAAGLQETNPELKFRKMRPDAAFVVFLRTDIAPFKDVRVRQALMLGIDYQGIVRDYYKGNAVIQTWPIAQFMSCYTPLEELPADAQELYSYNTDKAKKLLADAGYPTGFKTQLDTGNWARYIDDCSLIKEYLSKIGLDVNINVTEPGTYSATLYGEKYPGMIYVSGWGNNGDEDVLGWAHGGWVGTKGEPSVYDFGKVVDPVAVDAFNKIMTTPTQEERDKLRKEEAIREIKLAWELPMPTPNGFMFWQPWLKGFAGEYGLGPDPPEGYMVFGYVWIDRALKNSLTGR